MVLVLIPLQLVRIREERRALEAKFGDAYREYRKRVQSLQHRFLARRLLLCFRQRFTASFLRSASILAAALVRRTEGADMTADCGFIPCQGWVPNQGPFRGRHSADRSEGASVAGIH